MTVFEFNIDPDRNALIRRALAKRILRQREIEEEEASTEEDESFLGRPIARRKQLSSRQGSQSIHDDTQQTNTTAISVTITQPNGATTTASRAAAAEAAAKAKATDPGNLDNKESQVDQGSRVIATGTLADGTAATIDSPSHYSHGDGMKHKNRWKSEYLRATSETSQTDRGSSPVDVLPDTVLGDNTQVEGTNKTDGGSDDNAEALSLQQDTVAADKRPASAGERGGPLGATGFPNSASGSDNVKKEEAVPFQPDPVEQAILAQLDELRKEKTRLFQLFKEAIAQKSAMAASASAPAPASSSSSSLAPTLAPVPAVQPQAPAMMLLEGTTTSNPDTMSMAMKNDSMARRLPRNEVEVSYPSDQKVDIGAQENRKKLEVEIPRDRHSPGAEVPPSLSSAASTASSYTPYSPVHSHSSHPPSDRNHPSSSPSTTASTMSSSSPPFVSPSKGGSGVKRPRSDSPPPLPTLSQEGSGGASGGSGGGSGGGAGGGAGPRRRPRHFDDRLPRAPAAGTGSGGSDPTARKPLPTYPGLPSKPQIRQPFGGGGNKYNEAGRDRGRGGPYGGSSSMSTNANTSGAGIGGPGGNLEGKHALPRRPFLDESRNRGSGSGAGGGGGGGPSGPHAGASGSGLNATGGGGAGAGRSGGGSYVRSGGSSSSGGGGGGGHSSLPDRPMLDYRPVLGGPQGRPLPFSRSMMQMPRPGGFLPGRPPTLMRPAWPRRGSRS